MKHSFHTCCPIMLRLVQEGKIYYTPQACACDFPELRKRFHGEKRCPSNKPCFLCVEHPNEVTEAQRKEAEQQ